MATDWITIMAKSIEQMEIAVRTGGNLEPGYVFDPRATPSVRLQTDAERKALADDVRAGLKLNNKIADDVADTNAKP